LKGADRTDVSYETVIYEFSDLFDEDVVKEAQERLKRKKPVDPKSDPH
jgi:hypothetical protein